MNIKIALKILFSAMLLFAANCNNETDEPEDTDEPTDTGSDTQVTDIPYDICENEEERCPSYGYLNVTCCTDEGYCGFQIEKTPMEQILTSDCLPSKAWGGEISEDCPDSPIISCRATTEIPCFHLQGCELAEGGCGYWLDYVSFEMGEGPGWFILLNFDLECLPYEEFNL